jgi:ERCC4-type nuclease
MYKLIVDNREQQIIELFKNNVDYSELHNVIIEYKTMTVGDFAYVIDGDIKFIIERKTWKDLAASITGDRYCNVEKLLSVKCKHIYIIEGKFNPDRKSHVGNGKSIIYKSMYAYLDHLIFNDNIHIIHTLNKNDTINRIFELIHNFNSIKIKNPKRNNFINTINIVNDTELIENDVKEIVNDTINIENATKEILNDTKEILNDTKEILNDTINIENDTKKNNSNQLFTKFIKNDESVINDMINIIPKISVVFANILTNTIHPIRILRNEFNINEIANIRYPSGVTFGLNKAKVIKNFTNLLHEKSTELKSTELKSKESAIKILSCINGMSKTKAEIILSKYNFNYLSNLHKLNKIETDLFINTTFDIKTTIKNKKTTDIETFLHNSYVKDSFTIKKQKLVKLLSKIHDLFKILI